MIDQRFIDREIWLEAGRNGFLGLEVPEAYGGSEAGDYRFNAVLGDELSRASAAVASRFGIHSDVVAPYLVQLTTEEQKQRWLPKFSKRPCDMRRTARLSVSRSARCSGINFFSRIS